MTNSSSFKLPSSYTMLFLIIILAALATWIVPTGKYDRIVDDAAVPTGICKQVEANSDAKPCPGTYTQADPNHQGIYNILFAPIKGFYDAKDVIVFVLIIGGFLGIVLQTRAIDLGIMFFINKFKNRQHLIIPVLMFLFSIGGTTYGMGEELIGFYPIMIPIMIMAGYDKLVAAAILLLGAGVGVIGSTVNPFATGVASSMASVSIGEGLLLRVIIWLVCVSIAIFFVSKYANSVQRDKKTSLVYSQMESDKAHFIKSHHQDDEMMNQSMNISQRLTLIVFALTFGLMIFASMPFEDWGITAIPTLGWYMDEYAVLFFTSSIIVGLINLMPEEKFIDNFMAGVKDVIGVALIIGIARGVKIVMTEGVIIDTILYWTESLVNQLSTVVFINAVYVVNGLLSFIVPSSSGLATLVMPIIAPVGDIASVSKGLIVTAYQSASGLINLISPTSAILMGGITISRIDYKTWLKFVMPMFVIMSLVIAVIMSVSLIIG